MNLAFLLSDIAYGGASKSAYLLIKSLDKSKFDIFLFVKNRPRDQRLLDNFRIYCKSITIIDVPSIYSLGKDQQNSNPLKTVLVYKLYKKRIREFILELRKDSIGLIHINSTQFAYLAPVIKSELGIKIVSHVRELLGKKFKYTFQFIINCIIHYSDAIICISPNESIYLTKSNKVHIVANPFDFESINTFEYKSKSGSYVGMLGSFLKTKRADLFLKACKILKTDHPDFQYKFAILGASRKPLWKLIANIIIYWNFFPIRFHILLNSSIIKNDIILLPATDSIQDFFDILKIYVRPSGQPWGRDIIEAMAYGVPIVANGTSEFFIKHGVSGLLAKTNDPNDLAEKIFLLANDIDLQNQIVNNATQLVKMRCDKILHAKIIQDIYETC